MAAAGLTVFWWLFASRARVRDRWLGFLLLAAAGAASYWYSHQTIQGMVYLFYTLPTATAAFLIPLLLLGWFSRGVATWVAVAAGVACFGGGALVRNEGFSGDFRGAFDWRWKPNAEEQYLAQRKASKQAAPETARKEIPGIGQVRWPEFRGPKRDGAVPGVRLNEDWTAQPPKEIWRRKVGPGWSSFAATDDLLYTQEQRGETEAVVCYDAHTGSEVWSYEYPSRFWEAVGGAGPRATPTLHDGALFTLGANGVLCRLDPRTGSVAWTRDLRTDAGREPPMWGFSSSPLVANGCVIVHAGGAGDKGTLAYDVQTGEPRWGAPAGDHSYSSPQLATVAGRPSVLMLTNTGLHACDPLTGQTQWEHEWKFDGYRAIQPLVVGEASVLLGTGVGAGTRRIDLRLDGTSMYATERWTSLAMKPQFNDFVAHRGHLFGFDNNVFACIDLETGGKKWKEGRYGNGQVLLLPDGDQLLVSSEKGDLVLLRANPERHEERARFPALKGKTWNHPILVGNRLYVRNGEEAACFELGLAGSP
jgi:outer membrane protein assembly factor BamB